MSLEERRAKKSKVEYEEYVEEDTTEAEPTKGMLLSFSHLLNYIFRRPIGEHIFYQPAKAIIFKLLTHFQLTC